MAILPSHTLITVSLIAIIVASGTTYSYIHGTYLDTSNPLLTHLPHPSHKHSYFASKQTILNKAFVKYAWGWTSLAFWAVWFTAQEQTVVGGVKTVEAIGRWVTATAVWAAFASWFFGPSLFARILNLSGGECVIAIPPPPSLAGGDAKVEIISVPTQLCQARTLVSPQTHPGLFVHPPVAAYVADSMSVQPTFKAIPRLYKGHDVSGHTFILTLATLFLVDALLKAKRGSVKGASLGAQVGAWSLVSLWLVMIWATAVYFHTWEEKASGFVIGVIGYAISQLPFSSSAPTAAPTNRPRFQK